MKIVMSSRVSNRILACIWGLSCYLFLIEKRDILVVAAGLIAYMYYTIAESE